MLKFKVRGFYPNVWTLWGGSGILRYYKLKNPEPSYSPELSYSNSITAVVLNVISLLGQINIISRSCHVATGLTELFFYIPIEKED